MPELSIITVTYNGWENTSRLLASIRAGENTTWDLETIVVSNGNRDERPPETYLAHKFISNPTNRGWTAGVNQGLAVAEGKYIIWMNDDIVVSPGWAERLLRPLRERWEIGLTGPVTDYSSGPQMVPPNYDPDRWHEQLWQTPRLVGFCMATRREVVDEVGGLDEYFGTCGFDDDDYSLRVQRAGYQCVIVRDAFIHHEGHATYKREGVDLSEGLKEGWRRFKEKWGLPPDVPYGTPIPYDRLIMADPDPRKDFFDVKRV